MAEDARCTGTAPGTDREAGAAEPDAAEPDALEAGPTAASAAGIAAADPPDPTGSPLPPGVLRDGISTHR
ncbi:hypothetical protein GCM10011583_35250 [Streptomyces camponoticapitis]|uniref:Uncharacterized protein n=1 Tax=Streptomyces camponoticapitis TaxID=1616125 RepID=A0ABQ2ECX5_9ACTN|nr:hypothetical protein GCM10011583_35250 [Streptomyces camponoticapitis]